MPAQLSYVPVAEYRTDKPEFVEETREFARHLFDREVPACFFRRNQGQDLHRAILVAKECNSRGILTVVELHPDDPVLPFRNLSEWAVSGTMDLQWVDGSPAFNLENVLELLDGAGRHRLVLDLNLRFTGSLPDEKDFKTFVRKAGKWTKKYSHVQSVKLAGIPDNTDESTREILAGYYTWLLEVSRWSMRSISASIWSEHRDLGSIASDFGSIAIDPELDEPLIAVQKGVDLAGAVKLAKEMAVPVVARLPIIPRFYSRGWYAFEVGKALDAWIDRSAFSDYRNRPGWLEDPR